MYIVHRDVLTLYAGKSVNHPLLHMESFTTSSKCGKSVVYKGAVSRNSAKSGYCKMPVKLKET